MELLIPIALLAFFYLLIIRPARSRQRQAAQLQNQLTEGQQVMTTSGLYATVRGVDGDAVLLEVAPGFTLRWAKAAVARIVTAEESTSTDDSDDDDPSHPDGPNDSDGQHDADFTNDAHHGDDAAYPDHDADDAAADRAVDTDPSTTHPTADQPHTPGQPRPTER